MGSSTQPSGVGGTSKKRGLLKAALRGEDPVVFLEPKLLYQTKGMVPLGSARVARAGNDVTVVATWLMVSRAEAAADALQKLAIDIEIIDPRSISPVDWAMIFTSVDKAARALIVTEATLSCSVASEIAATIVEQRFMSLDGPVRRIGSPFVPKPSTPVLETLSVPGSDDIVRVVLEMVRR
jgi:acetoin:2,6-dichlorophenolindophenol oxidoreductase subunit beta